jgi:hypothetical protein
MSSSDPFAQFAEEAIVAPRKRRLRAAEKRAERKRLEALEKRSRMFRLWQKWHRKQVEKLLAGPYGTPAQELASFLETMTLTSGSELIELIHRGPWCDTDPDTRFEVLRLIDGALAHLRERDGRPPFDDALPGEPLTVFQIIRAELSHD